VAFSVMRLSQAFQNAIFRAVAQQLTRFQPASRLTRDVMVRYRTRTDKISI